MLTALIILVWEVLGFQLAYSKGQQGSTVTWIGGTLSVESEGVRAMEGSLSLMTFATISQN